MNCIYTIAKKNCYWNGRNAGYKLKNNLKAGSDKPVKLINSCTKSA
jgi:hypothetical protein